MPEMQRRKRMVMPIQLLDHLPTHTEISSGILNPNDLIAEKILQLLCQRPDNRQLFLDVFSIEFNVACFTFSNPILASQ